VSPICLHQDARIGTMLLITMLTLLVYAQLERQACQHALAITTARIVASLRT